MNKKITISCRVRDLRQEKKLTQEELAQKLGISRQSIISVEKGQCLPSLSLALQIAQTFQSSIEEIFFPEFFSNINFASENWQRGEKMDSSLQPLSPFREVSTLHDEIDRLFDDTFFSAPANKATMAIPAINLHEKDNNLILEADLPGVKEEDLEIEIGENYLILKGERKYDQISEEKKFYCRETSYGAFSRTISLPTEIKTDKVQAEMKHGTLKITMPIMETKKPKTIKIKIDKPKSTK